MNKDAPQGIAARAVEMQTLRAAALVPFRMVTLSATAEDIATRVEVPEKHKVRILLAIVRAQGEPTPDEPIESMRDVERLALTRPREFEKLLRGYWLLLGARRTSRDLSR